MKLLFTGDSLIEYFDWSRRFSAHEVYNLGIGGETVEGLHRRLEHLFLSIPSADIVFIMSGINNVSMGDMSFIGTYGKVIGSFVRRYDSAKIVVQSLLPVIFPFVSNEDITDINRKLKALSDEKGTCYFDIHHSFIDASGRPNPALLLDDGVHISDEGYRVWSGEIEKRFLA